LPFRTGNQITSRHIYSEGFDDRYLHECCVQHTV
jgi:hypothetical protein